MCQAPSLEHFEAFGCCNCRSKCDWETWSSPSEACRGYTRGAQARTRASLWQEMRALTRACPAVDACMGPSACFGLLFLQLVLCAFLICSCACPMIGASLSSFICIEVQLCFMSNFSSARIGLGRL